MKKPLNRREEYLYLHVPGNVYPDNRSFDVGAVVGPFSLRSSFFFFFLISFSILVLRPKRADCRSGSVVGVGVGVSE